MTRPGTAVPQPSEAADQAVSSAAPARAAARRARAAALLPWAGLVLSLGLWAYGLSVVPAAAVATSGLGLVPVLGGWFWAGLAVLLVSFCWVIGHRAASWPLAGAHLAALVAVLHATPAILYGTLRYSWAWKHIGVTGYIAHHGIDFHLGGVLGAYQGWPGFFALNAFLSSGSGLQSALGYASWALVAADLLWLGPVILIARAFTSDRRLVWAAALLFELGNWVGQDYFSPQALAFFLYLTVIAISLRWLASPRCRPEGSPPVSRAARYALLACLLPLMLAIASSHQLTPVMLITALALLAVFGKLTPRVLPVAMAAVTAVGWLGYGALPWLKANSYQLFAGLGVPWANTSAHLVGQGAIPADQALVNWGARFLSVGIGLLALVGYWRQRRRAGRAARRSWNRLALLTIAAVPSAGANSYGGEIIFRVFLFALPFLAVAAAAAFFPQPASERGGQPGLEPHRAAHREAQSEAHREPASWLRRVPGPGLSRWLDRLPHPGVSRWLGRVPRPDLDRCRSRPPRRRVSLPRWARPPAAARATVALMLTAVVLAGGYCLGNYGKEAMNYFTPQEVAAAQWLYRTAPRGAQLIAANSNFPWAFVHYDWYTYTFLDTPPALGNAMRRAPVATMVRLMQPGRVPPSYLILTTSQAAEISLTGEWPPGAFGNVSRALLASGAFKVVYHNSDATILQLAP
jgi:hypothetical protein